MAPVEDLLDSCLCELVWRRRNKDEELFDAIWKDINLYWGPEQESWVRLG